MRRLLLLLVVGLFLVGCGGSQASDSSAEDADDTTAGTDAAAASAPATAGDASAPAGGASADAMAPFGTVQTVAGDTLDGAEYAGDSLALWFWAPW